MKKVLAITLFLAGCIDADVGSSKEFIDGFFLKKSDCQSDYYAFSYSGKVYKEQFTPSDTLIIDGILRGRVFFARIEQKNLKKDGYQNMNFN
jgi:hypothetical protein